MGNHPRIFLWPYPSLGVLVPGLQERGRPIEPVSHLGDICAAFYSMLGIACFLLCSHLTYACGDKLLVLGRPLRFGSPRPAAILAYARSGSFLESVMKRVAVDHCHYQG